MKFLVTGFAQQPYPQSIVKKLQSLGHDVVFFPFLFFYHGSSYISRKLYKLGKESEKTAYQNAVSDKLLDIFYDFRPDVLLALNHTIYTQALQKIDYCKKIIWLWDSIERFPEMQQILPYFDRIFAFEQADVPIIQTKWDIPTVYLPLGFDEEIYTPKNTLKDIDLSFVGVKNEQRLNVLNQVAKHMKEHGRSMFIGGKWYEEKHFWKKGHFLRKNPYLTDFLQNRFMSPEEISEIYNRSKICLNITVEGHKNLNPRTFETLATKSFLLMNEGQQTLNILEPGKDYVEYSDVADLLDKIEYYLTESKITQQIASNGYEKIKDKYSIEKLLGEILEQV